MHGMRGTSDGRVASNVSLSAYFCSVGILPPRHFAFCCFVLYAVISVVVEGVTTHEPPPRPTS